MWNHASHLSLIEKKKIKQNIASILEKLMYVKSLKGIKLQE